MATDVTLGTIEYNGVTIGGTFESLELFGAKASLQTSVVYDSADLNSLYHRNILTVVFYTIAPTSEDSAFDLAALRKALLEPRRELDIQQTGMLPDDVTITDVDRGPHPRECAITPLGGNTTHEVTWVIEFASTPCETDPTGDDVGEYRSILYSITQDVNASGGMTRTISGVARFLRQLEPGEDVAPDGVLASVPFNVAVPVGFKRESFRTILREDRVTVEFTIVDVQLLDGTFPPNVETMSVRMTHNYTSAGLASSQATCVGSITMKPTVDPYNAILVMFRELTARQKLLQQDSGSYTAPVLQSLRVTREIYSRTTEFEATWIIPAGVSLLLGQNLWVPTDENADAWRDSMSDIWTPTGTSGLADEYTTPVTTACEPTPAQSWSTSSVRVMPNRGKKLLERFCPEITPENSWLLHDLRTYISRKQNVAQVNKAVQPEFDNDAGMAPPVEGEDNAAIPAIPERTDALDEDANAATDTEQVGLPEVRVALAFKGLRIKFSPQMPRLLKYGGRDVDLLEELGSDSYTFGQTACERIYAINRTYVYLVKGYPEGDEIQFEKPQVGWLENDNL